MINDYVTDLQKRVMTECEHFSEDVKYWAEYKTGIRGFKPWSEASEKRATGGLSKPQTLDEANAMFAQVNDFDQNCLKHLKVLLNAETAANKMTTHKEAFLPEAYRERTAWMATYMAGVLNVSNMIWVIFSLLALGLRGASVKRTGCSSGATRSSL